MRWWQSDGWTEQDWENIASESGNALIIAQEIDDFVGGGGGGFPPKELEKLAERLQEAADRLKKISGNYF